MRNKTVHFSVDDTIWLFHDLNSNNYGSAFEQPTLAFFLELHQKYGTVISFYCFGEQDWMKLENVTDRYRYELEKNGDWLRFGFHAQNEHIRYAEVDARQAAADYADVTAQLRRITGANLDAYPRIHCYSANRPALEAMQGKGLRGVLCSESEEIIGYDLEENEAQRLRSVGIYSNKASGLTYLTTDIRIEETICMLEPILTRRNRRHLEVFTHEWALEREYVQEKIRICCSLLSRMGYQGSFWEGT